jgi:hypothetical protein
MQRSYHPRRQADIILNEDVDSSIRICLFEAHRLKSGAHLVIPVISALLGAIERLLQQADQLLWTPFNEALWLLHVDVTIHVAIQIGIRDVD